MREKKWKKIAASLLVAAMIVSLGSSGDIVSAADLSDPEEEVTEEAPETETPEEEIPEEKKEREETPSKDSDTADEKEAGEKDRSSHAIQTFRAEDASLEDQYQIYFLDNKKEVETYSVTYNGKAQKPDIVVKNPDNSKDELDLDDEDDDGNKVYTVEYKNNTDAGTATVTVYETDNKEDQLSADFTIEKQSISKATLTLSTTEYTYKGSARKPGTTVVTTDGTTLKKDTDYTVSYSKNNQIGTAKATATGKGNYTGSVSANFKIKLAKAKIKSLTPFYNGITVKWEKTSGATKFVIYRSKKKNSGFKKIKTIKDTSVSSYKDTGRKIGTTYYYKVRAYHGSSYTVSNVKSAKVRPKKAVITKVSIVDTTTLKVKWNKVSGASGYYVYRSTKQNGTYKKIATIKKKSTLSYKDKNRTAGKTYYYKVAAYRTEKGKKYTGVKSDAVSGKTKPGKVTLSKATFKDGNVTLTWKKVTGATGYEVYRSTSKSSGYSLKKTTSDTTWSNKRLTGGKTYYYKVRAYKKVNGKKIYGDYSSVKAVTTTFSRGSVVNQAKAWIGTNEYSSGHLQILDIYNSHLPLARGYTVLKTDSWCATFVSSVAIYVNYTSIMPTECGCEKMIELYEEIGRWKEDDSYTPKKGDVIFYDWDDDGNGDCTGWSDHVGIVEKVSGSTITVIEGNSSNTVKRRTIQVNGRYIRGYGVPKYTSS